MIASWLSDALGCDPAPALQIADRASAYPAARSFTLHRESAEVAPKDDRLADLYASVGSLKPNPWARGGTYKCDAALLRRLIQVQVDNGKADNAQTGGVATAVDVWVACELRRAGIESDAVWPRPRQPRVVAQSLIRAVNRFRLAKNAAQADVQQRTIDSLVELAGSGRSTVVGGQFPKTSFQKEVLGGRRMLGVDDITLTGGG